MVLNDRTFPAVMKDEALEKELNENGYLVFRNFFDEEALKEVIEYHEKNQPQLHHYDAIANTVWHTDDIDYRINTNKFAMDVFGRVCDKLMKDYRIIGGSYVIKPPHGLGISYPHIDYGIVDEEKYRSFNLWSPLLDLNENNGALQVLKGSHKMKQVLRGPNIEDQCIGIREWLWEKKDKLYINAGDAIFYDHRAIHGSGANNADIPRVAFSCAVTHVDAPMIMYFLDETGKKVNAYEIDEEKMKHGEEELPPKGREPYKVYDYEPWQLTLPDLGYDASEWQPPQPEPELVLEVPEPQKKSLLTRVKELFA